MSKGKHCIGRREAKAREANKVTHLIPSKTTTNLQTNKPTNRQTNMHIKSKKRSPAPSRWEAPPPTESSVPRRRCRSPRGPRCPRFWHRASASYPQAEPLLFPCPFSSSAEPRVLPPAARELLPAKCRGDGRGEGGRKPPRDKDGVRSELGMDYVGRAGTGR